MKNHYNKVIFFFGCFIIMGSNLFAQVKIGDNPTTVNSDAVLEIESTTKGLLLPRIALSSTTLAAPLSAHVEGMTVYNTATAGDVTPGKYYNDGTKWVRVANATDILPSENIYNSDGALTSNRSLDLNGSYLQFNGAAQRTSWNLNGGITQTNLLPASGSASMGFLGGNNTNLYIQAFSGGSTQIIASGNATNFTIGTGYTANPTYIRFDTSLGGGVASNPAVYINSAGNLGIGSSGLTASEKLDVTEGNARIRDINTNIGAATDNVVVADTDGVLKTVTVDGLVSEPWLNQANDTQATDNTQNIYQMGLVGIGTQDMLGNTNPDVQLAVNGSIITTTSIYADYVFEDYFKGYSELNKDYSFKSLKEVERFIKENKHLPGITKIDALSRNEKGDYVINQSELSVQLLEKVEELFLHTIEQQNEIDAKDKKITALETKQDEMEKRMARMEKLLEKLEKE